MRSSMCLVLLYYNGGNYKKSIEETRFTEKYAEELHNTEYLSDICRMKSNAYGEMGLLDESLKELENALPYADEIVLPLRFYKKALIYESYAGVYDKKGDEKKQLYYRQKSIAVTEKINDDKDNPILTNAKYQNLGYQYASMGYVYSNLKIKDSANYYFNQALKIVENGQHEIYTNVRATLFSDMAKFYDSNKESGKAIVFAKRAENLEKQAPMPYIRKDIFNTLFNSYIETNKKDSSKYYLKLYTKLNDSLIKSEKEGIMTPVNQIISDNESENKNTIRNILLIVLPIIVILIFSLIYWRRKNNTIHKKYEELIARLNFEKTLSESPEEVKEEAKKETVKPALNITDETLNKLLQKLEKFEKSDKYLKQEISLTYLANNLGTNTKYLSEIIKQHKGKSFNNYINGLRIDYMVKELYSNPKLREYKISHLAEISGFASREVFAIVFKKETGITPSYFINNLEKEKGSGT
ncbi:MAG: helix-turn-helix transcriptional regulator [Flavobacterium sp.]